MSHWCTGEPALFLPTAKAHRNNNCVGLKTLVACCRQGPWKSFQLPLYFSVSLSFLMSLAGQVWDGASRNYLSPTTSPDQSREMSCIWGQAAPWWKQWPGGLSMPSPQLFVPVGSILLRKQEYASMFGIFSSQSIKVCPNAEAVSASSSLQCLMCPQWLIYNLKGLPKIRVKPSAISVTSSLPLNLFLPPDAYPVQTSGMVGLDWGGKGVNFTGCLFAFDPTKQLKNLHDIHGSLYCLEPGKINNTRAEIETLIYLYSWILMSEETILGWSPLYLDPLNFSQIAPYGTQ